MENQQAQTFRESARPRPGPGPGRVPGCASWARNPKGPQITPFCHQMGRHPTVLDISDADFDQNFGPDLSRGVPGSISRFFVHYFWTSKSSKIPKSDFEFTYMASASAELGKSKNGAQGGPWGPKGAHFPLFCPLRGPRGPHFPIFPISPYSPFGPWALSVAFRGLPLRGSP